ncbi:OmpA family protein [Amycolatopsis umgeniensis]|uniref:Outer membrane protein OmpA-like peptidoglycan-associated protein n=1 Tax=Amycolatopsis umgeniensis TaxID=336628 RepID=A0A841B3L0_9PSEU|nr:cell envelope biogenesis protein OmpA [Amycolatopsis umgeniensis]MBB5853315.1 outer membrane protein OmpA-like peptidoglycan-associated protein [Amycolatopsis umgeniensis]
MPGTRWSRLLPTALLVTLALTAISVWSASDDIEAELSARAKSALADVGVTGGQVSFSGRDASLAGFPPDKAAQAMDAIQRIDGVRTVEISGDTAPPAGPVTTSGEPSSPPPAPPSPPPSPTPTSAKPTDKAGFQAEIDRLLTATPITFEPDTTELTADGERGALEIAKLLEDAPPELRFRITGQVASGSDKKLSLSRALTVERLLERSGVKRDQAYSTQRRNSDGASGEGRRVDITAEQR